MSGIHNGGTELSEFNSNINIVGSEYDDNNHLSVVSAYTRKLEDNTQHLQVPKKQNYQITGKKSVKALNQMLKQPNQAFQLQFLQQITSPKH